MTEETESSEETDRLRRHNELILAAAGEGIFGLDTQGRTTFVNPAAVDLSGWGREEMIGRRQHEMVHHTKPDGRPYPSEECPIHASFKDGEVHRVSNEVFWRKDGSSFPVEYVSTPIQEEGTLVGAVVAFRDITKRRQAEDALKESEARFRKIFNATYDAFFLVDMEQEKIFDVNNESCRMLGYSRDELTALSVRDVHPNEMPMMREFASRVFERGKWQTQELTCRAKGGEFIPAELSATSIEFEGRPYMLVLAHDMRERRRAEARVRGLQADLQHVSRLSAMGEMASGLAHELNQPLTAIRNYVQASRRMLTAQDGEASDKVHEYMDKAIAQTDRAGQIMRRMREFVEKGETDRSFEDVNEVVEEASKLALVGARDINIEVEFNFGTDLPQVLVDRIQIQQVVVNLVRNGVEALTDSKVRKLSISTAATEGDGVEVAVCDSGPGVTKEISGRLFQSFVTTKAQGMGLGLSICRSIVEDHGGRLWAERNQERGMTFRLTLPISPPDEESPE